MSKHNFSNITIECVQGDITSQPDILAVVNAANAELRTGGGVAGAIHRGAGPKLEKECRPLAPIQPGDAVITGAHNLPNRYMIHCLGPIYGVDEPSDKLLADCYRPPGVAESDPASNKRLHYPFNVKANIKYSANGKRWLPPSIPPGVADSNPVSEIIHPSCQTPSPTPPGLFWT